MDVTTEILIVEDSRVQAAALQRILEEAGHGVTVAYDGQEALNALQATRPALVITDVLMPGMDGYELCAHIKRDSDLHDLPVMLLTELRTPADIIRGLEVGANSFMTKPYESDALLARIRYVLANQVLRQTSRLEMGLEVEFSGQRHLVTADRMQILDLLLASYESAVHKNRQLEQSNRELLRLQHSLQEANRRLETEIEERRQAEEALQSTRAELEKKVDEQRRLLSAMAGREVRMAELKQVIRQLRDQLIDAGMIPAANDPLLSA